ncbi:hypothetical protein DH2020_004464 [Rehmannia glutinosa]|uniref:RING-type E3 ubiquitin transferase n=1 Tax=Rehmannia glutinosa TaxID=99300 RepID=A0ABR0XPT1_REHGL
MADMDHQELRIENDEPGKGYALSGKIMLCAIVILFAVVVFMVGLHLYARWYLVRVRRRQIERRRVRRISRTELIMYIDNRLIPAAPEGRGLERAVLNSLPVYLYKPKAEQPPPECAVCLSEFEEKEIVRVLPNCAHSFHIECIDMWFRSHSTCPLCRSPVERVIHRRSEPVVRPAQPVETANESEPSSSSGSGPCDRCQHEDQGSGDGNNTKSLGARRKGVELAGVRIEVPPRRAEPENELSQSSPGGRLLSLKRILSMGRRSPATTPCGAGTSRVAGEMDLESGISESTREPVRV